MESTYITSDEITWESNGTQFWIETQVEEIYNDIVEFAEENGYMKKEELCASSWDTPVYEVVEISFEDIEDKDALLKDFLDTNGWNGYDIYWLCEQSGNEVPYKEF